MFIDKSNTSIESGGNLTYFLIYIFIIYTVEIFLIVHLRIILESQ